jgi:microcystin-dependent protein
MSDSLTTYLGLTKPAIGASRDTWGDKLNGDMDVIDAAVFAAMPIGALVSFAGANAPFGWLLADGTIYQVTAQPALFAVIGNRFGGDGVSTFAVPSSLARIEVGVGTTQDANGNNPVFTLGQSGGAAAVLIAQANLPDYQLTVAWDGDHSHTGTAIAVGDHTHAGYTDVQGFHGHNYRAFGFSPGTMAQSTFGAQINDMSGSTDGAGDHNHNVQTYGAGNHGHSLTVDQGGDHSHDVMLGGGGVPLVTQPPFYVVTKIIYAGPPAAARRSVMGQLAAPQMLRSPMRGRF